MPSIADDKKVTCSFCGERRRVVRASSGEVTICVDCAALAMRIFTQAGVVPEEVHFVEGILTDDDIERLRKEDDSEDES